MTLNRICSVIYKKIIEVIDWNSQRNLIARSELGLIRGAVTCDNSLSPNLRPAAKCVLRATSHTSWKP